MGSAHDRSLKARSIIHWYKQSKLPQIRYVAYLTMVLYFIYAAIEYHVAADQQVLRLFLYGWLGHSRRAARHSAARLANSQWC